MSSDEKKNQGAVAGTRDPQDPRAPQCNATVEMLRADNYKIGDVCPVCGDFGKKVRVGAHPSQPAATTDGKEVSVSTEQVMVARLIQGVPKEYDDTATLCAQQKEFKELVNRLSRYQQWCTGDVMIRCDACGLDLCVACDTEKHTEVVKAPHVRVEVAGAAPEKCSACRNRSDRRAPFVCIATSSGTGKSQLAVTAQKCLQDRGGRVVYFNMSTIIDTSSQDFYKPHAELGKTIQAHFRCDVEYTVESVPSTSTLGYGLLKYVLCGKNEAKTEETTVKPCTLDALTNAVNVQKQDGDLLVFIDEVPKEGSVEHRACVFLRSVLRRVGVCPVLLSREEEALRRQDASRLGYVQQMSVLRVGSLPARVQRLRRTPRPGALLPLNSNKIIDTAPLTPTPKRHRAGHEATRSVKTRKLGKM